MKYLVLCLFGFYLTAQELPVVYVDESLQTIPEEVYVNKQKMNIFLEAEIVTDTVIYKKLFYNKFFGTLDKNKKSQLNKLLYQRYQMDSSKVWVIHYTDSLPDVTTLPKKDKIVYKPVDSTQESKEAALYFNSINRIRSNSFSSTDYHEKLNRTKRYHHFSYKSWYNSRKKEIKKYSKIDNTLLLHFYDYNAGFPAIDKNVKWHKDPYSIIKSIFSDGVKNYSRIIIHPDGDFFVSYCCLTFEEEKELTNKEFFDKKKNL